MGDPRGEAADYDRERRGLEPGGVKSYDSGGILVLRSHAEAQRRKGTVCASAPLREMSESETTEVAIWPSGQALHARLHTSFHPKCLPQHVLRQIRRFFRSPKFTRSLAC